MVALEGLNPSPEQLREWQRQAAAAAVDEVASAMVVGLGHGRTAGHALELLGQRLRWGELRDIRGVACSRAVAVAAQAAGIPLLDERDFTSIDLTIDGADEVAADLTLLKGGGGALTRERIVAQASRRRVYVVDATKLSPVVGTRQPVVVEVLDFGLAARIQWLEGLGAEVRLRRNGLGQPTRTDQGHLLLDCHFGPVPEPAGLAARLEGHAGLVGHGLFVDLAQSVMVAGPEGVRRLTPQG